MKPQRDEAPKKIKLSNLWDNDIDEHAEWLRGKREDIAITINGMLHECKFSRADLARVLKWQPSRVTRALSGGENLTINTLAEIIGAANLDFDILIRPRTAVRAFQPWEEPGVMAELIYLRQLRATLNEARTHCCTAIAMLRTAQEINRAAFRMAAPQAVKRTVNRTYSYTEERNAPVACEA